MRQESHTDEKPEARKRRHFLNESQVAIIKQTIEDRYDEGAVMEIILADDRVLQDKKLITKSLTKQIKNSIKTRRSRLV